MTARDATPARHEVVVVPTGTANLASLLAALGRAGVEARLASTAGDIERADRVVLPGVGAFGAALARLRASGLDGALTEFAVSGRPLLAICLGLQLLARGSGESPGVPGLGILDAAVRRFEGDLRVPHLGWNQVVPGPGCRWIAPGHAAFAHSYRLSEDVPGWRAAWSDHGGRFVAALERGRQVLCQFHPELSGAWGASLLGRWLAAPQAEASPADPSPADVSPADTSPGAVLPWPASPAADQPEDRAC